MGSNSLKAEQKPEALIMVHKETPRVQKETKEIAREIGINYGWYRTHALHLVRRTHPPVNSFIIKCNIIPSK